MSVRRTLSCQAGFRLGGYWDLMFTLPMVDFGGCRWAKTFVAGWLSQNIKMRKVNNRLKQTMRVHTDLAAWGCHQTRWRWRRSPAGP